jgi:adenosyl cobinamide kinase/adenosyl cobinamide phosphate guanylyltransferase
MILIIGGAYQGKLDYSRQQFGLSDADVFICNAENIDFSKRCVYRIEEFTRNNSDPIAYFKEHKELWQDSILICQDIFCGVVPMGAENRDWRQNTGRLCQYLSNEADQVIRIFCGLEQRLK